MYFDKRQAHDCTHCHRNNIICFCHLAPDKTIETNAMFISVNVLFYAMTAIVEPA